MIGGTDVVIPAVGNPAALDACVRIVHHHWPEARFEDALNGKKYTTFAAIPIGRVRELFIYRDTGAEAAWDAENHDAAPNTMIYLISSARAITAGVEEAKSMGMSEGMASP